VRPSYRILFGFVVLVLLAVPLRLWFGWSAMWGYLFGLVMMTAYLLYLLLFVELTKSNPLIVLLFGQHRRKYVSRSSRLSRGLVK